MSVYFSATIMWQDGEICEGYIFKVGDVVESEDDNVFFYLESEGEIESFKEEGVEDFVLLNYEQVNI